jgi:hypothetical protein
MSESLSSKMVRDLKEESNKQINEVRKLTGKSAMWKRNSARKWKL